MPHHDQKPRFTIRRDARGHPAIFAGSAADAAYGLARAHMHDAAHELLCLLARAAGRLAEVLGPTPGRRRAVRTDPRVRSDLTVRAFDLPRRARAELSALPARTRTMVEAYARGVDDARREAARVRRDPVLALPVRAWHVAALDLLVAAAGHLSPPFGTTRARASNAVAVARRRSRDEDALLLIDPHLPLFAMPEIRPYAFQVAAPGYRAAGFGRIGSPFLCLGATDRVAFAACSNWPVARFSERIAAGRPRPVRIRIRIAGRDPLETRVWRSAGWPARPTRGGSFVLERVAALEGGSLSRQFHAMARARTARGVLRAAIANPGLAGQTFLAADRDGRIAGAWCARGPGDRPAGAANRVDAGGADGILVNGNASPEAMRPGAVALPRRAPWFSDPRPLTSFRHVALRDALDPAGRIGGRDLMRLLDDPKNLLAQCLIGPLGLADSFRGWDRRDRIGSRKAALFQFFLDAWIELDPRASLWIERPEFLPGAFDARARRAARLALRAATRAHRRSGYAAWGGLHTLHCGDSAVALDGSAHTLSALSPWPAGRPGSGLRHGASPVEHGSACTMIVRLGPAGVRVWMRKPCPNAPGASGDLRRAFAEEFARAGFYRFARL